MKIIYIGQFDNVFNYKIELNGNSFKFTTGLGWVETTGKGIYKKEKRKEPTESDVLECLKSDVDAGNMSFSDFCDSFGYSDDSLTALDIYRACQDTAKKLRSYNFPVTEEN